MVQLVSGSAGEGSGHTTRVYVTEESHCGMSKRIAARLPEHKQFV